MALKDQIRKFVLANAYEHDGKAQPGAIVGKLIGTNLITKDQIGKTMPDINKIVSEVNKLSVEKQKAELETVYPELFEKKEAEVRTLKPLLGAKDGKVVMRFEPSFSGRLHIGHAFPFSLNYAYVKMYKGKLILRLADTNPNNTDSSAYKGIPIDADWLTSNGVDQVVIQSDHMPTYYKYAEEFINGGIAYVCTCDLDKWKKLVVKKKACPCRSVSPKENFERWKKMLTTYKEGEAVLRIKTDIRHPNPAIRDWPAARIIETKHPRQGKKYRVWPLMNLSVTIDDHESGITHAIRAKEHMDNEKRQLYLYQWKGWEAPKQLYVGRLKFEDLELSKSKIRSMIESGKYTGWDDVRLPTLPALRRRGYLPQAIVELYSEIGVSEADKRISGADFFKSLDSMNRKFLDPITDRYFMVVDPVKISVDGAPLIKSVKLKYHPDKEKTRAVKVGKAIYVAKEDLDKFKNKEVRLLHLYNIILNRKAKFTSKENKDIQKIQWVSEPNVKVRILMPDGTEKKAIAEPDVKKLKESSIIQADRIGFMKLDSKKKMLFCYAHR